MEDRRPLCTTANPKWMWATAPIPVVIPGKLNMYTQLYGKCQRWQNYLTNVTSPSKFVWLIKIIYLLVNFFNIY